MGQTLSEPVTAKDSACCQNQHYRVGSSCMQGWRVSMEDSHTHILSLPDDPGTAFFGVFDGHGGGKIADYAGKHLHKYIAKQSLYKKGQVEDGMRQAFLDIDRAMLNEESLKYEQCGSTAVTILIKNGTLFCANVGDSRAVACINGTCYPLSHDHKPTHEKEYHRITAAGGWIEANRVNGNLALSRALGDFTFKRNEKKGPQDQIVTAYPDIEVKNVTPEWEFIVMACDGIWDVVSNKEAVHFVRGQIAEGKEPEEICESLMMHCMAPDYHNQGIGCDNMTVIIVAFLHGGSYEELSARCATPSEETQVLQAVSTIVLKDQT